MQSEYRVAIVALPNFTLLALSCIVDTLRLANRALGREAYRWTVYGLHETVAASSHVSILPHKTLAGAHDDRAASPALQGGEHHPSGFNAQPVGTGPYLLKSRTAGSHMVYEANPNYHRGQAKIRQFIHKFVPDQLVAYGQARTGEIDYLGVSGVPFDRWGEAAKLPDRTFFPLAQPWVQFVYFNCGKPQFKDPKVRRALYIALEMQKTIDDVFFGAYKRTLSYLHTSHWAYNHDLKDTGPNP
jgi:ABC-type transport system substrate-binding protein